MNYKFPGRAYTEEEKRAACDALFEAWKDEPHQRLGQLIDNAIKNATAHHNNHCGLFYMEDDVLVRTVVEYVANQPISPPHDIEPFIKPEGLEERLANLPPYVGPSAFQALAERRAAKAGISVSELIEQDRIRVRQAMIEAEEEPECTTCGFPHAGICNPDS